MLEKTRIVVENPHIPLDALLKAVRMDADPDPDDLALLRRMLAEALAAAKPKALYGLAQVGSRDKTGVTIEGVRFRSALVSQNLAKTSRIVPYVVTCGTEAEEWSQQYAADPLTQYWSDAIKLQLLGLAREELARQVRQRFFPTGDLSAMTPGSLPA